MAKNKKGVFTDRYTAGICDKFWYAVGIWLFWYRNGMWKSREWLKLKILVYKLVYVEIWYTANKSDSNESQSCYFFEPDLRHCFFFKPNLSHLIFKSLFKTVLGKSSVCSNVQINFETFYLQSRFSIFLLANFPDIFVFYLVLENLWKLFTSNIKNHMDSRFFYFFLSPHFLVH